MATPAKKPSKAKGTPPTTTNAPAGMDNTTKKDVNTLTSINFKVPEEFAHEWKVHCVTNKVSQVDQFKAMFEYWKANH